MGIKNTLLAHGANIRKVIIKAKPLSKIYNRTNMNAVMRKSKKNWQAITEFNLAGEAESAIENRNVISMRFSSFGPKLTFEGSFPPIPSSFLHFKRLWASSKLRLLVGKQK